MKHFVAILIIAIIGIALVSCATTTVQTTYLICTPQENVNQYKISFDDNSQLMITSSPQIVEGGMRLHYDLALLLSGNHSAKISACNVVGCSESASYTFIK